MRLLNGTIVILSVLVSTTTAHAERRCGWLENPAAGKWTLYDAQGGWQIMFTGGGFRAAEGLDKIPDLTLKEYIHTFAIHGYACACLDLDTEKESITRIHSVRQLPLSRCDKGPKIKYFLENE